MVHKKTLNRLVSLDILRIFALFLVVQTHIAQHFANILGMFFGIPGFYWVSLGGVGVTLFLILSGFVLELNYGHQKQEYVPFIVKRLKHIYPIYWASLILSIIVFALIHGWATTIQNVVRVTDLILSFSGMYALVGKWGGPFSDATWFIGVIVIMYLLFPWLSEWSKRRSTLILGLCLVVSVVTRLVVGNTPILPNRPLDWFPLSRLFEFYLGMYLANNELVLLRLRNFKPFTSFQPYIHTLAELSFPLYLVHYPLLILLTVLSPKLGSFLAIGVYLVVTFVVTYCLNFLVTFTLKKISAKT